MKRSKEKKLPRLPIVHAEQIRIWRGSFPDAAVRLLAADGAEFMQCLVMEECVILWPLKPEGLCQAAIDRNVRVAKEAVAAAHPEVAA